MHRVRLGYLREDGKIVTCYVRGDGYIEEMKDKLLSGYPSYERVKILIEHGAWSYIGYFLPDDSVVLPDLPKGFLLEVDRSYVSNNWESFNKKEDGSNGEVWNSLEEFIESDCFKFVFGFYYFVQGEWYYIDNEKTIDSMIKLVNVKIEE